MKKLLTLVLAFVVLCMLDVSVLAATKPVITQQPQNPTYNEYAVAGYSVTVSGDNLKCKWFMCFNGTEYNISDVGDVSQPWEGYAGASYGGTHNTNGKFTTFTYYFNGIGKELNGCYIYAVIDDGSNTVTSQKAYISVVENGKTPPATNVPPSMEVFKGDVLDLYCQAMAHDGSKLSYLWYETSTGKLQDIIAINRGSEESDTLRVDTGSCGTRYYVCGVKTANGGSAYTSVIPVTVIEKKTEVVPPQITTKVLQEGTAGQKYSIKLSCTDKAATFKIYENPDKINDFKKTGMSLTPQGTIEGTPTKAGVYTFTVCATGKNGTGYMTYVLTVKDVETKQAETEETTVQDESSESAGIIEESMTETDAVESTTDITDATDKEQEQNEYEKEKGMPWWGIALIALAAAGVGVGGTIVVLKRK